MFARYHTRPAKWSGSRDSHPDRPLHLAILAQRTTTIANPRQMGNALSMNKKTFAELRFASASVFMAAHLLNADHMINRVIPMVLVLWLGSTLQVPGQQS